ncbi:hypothetical protein Acr_26g0000550 [Actinidia rufa]|uniref:Uncharacterized protein n=1 Tax=Actinidia rufa TaxID=165716 RepID=A0A7J0H187_9ERIC|nr:hypothetical protein Acr_26g0000550 [Actinidia rufa]
MLLISLYVWTERENHHFRGFLCNQTDQYSNPPFQFSGIHYSSPELQKPVEPPCLHNSSVSPSGAAEPQKTGTSVETAPLAQEQCSPAAVVETALPRVQKARKPSQSAEVEIAQPPVQPGEGKFVGYQRIEVGRFSAGSAAGTVVVVVALGWFPVVVGKMIRHCRARSLVEEFHQWPVARSGTLLWLWFRRLLEIGRRWVCNQQSILLGFLGTRPRTIKGRPAQTNRNKGPGRGRSKPLRRGDQTKTMTVDGVMSRVRGSRRDPRKDEILVKILVEINQAKYSTSPKGEEETTLWLWASSDEYSDGGSGELNGEDLARFHGLVLPWSRGFGDRGTLLSFGIFGPHYRTVELAPTSHLLERLVNQRSAMSKRLKLSDLAKVVAQKAATSASKGIVISEGSETSGKRPLDDGSKGKQVAQSPEPKKARTDTGVSGAPAKPPVASGAGSSAHRTLGEALGPQASVMASAATAEKILAGVILPADKEKVDKLTFDQVVTKFIHALARYLFFLKAQNRAIELEGALAEEQAKGKKLAEDADARSKVVAKLEARISELEKSQSLTQGRIIAAFKESDDFLEAVRGSASSYFGDGFDFCKRQLAHQYPDLGVDLEDVEMDHEFLTKEEADAEQRAAEEGAAGAEGVGEAV